MTAILCRDPLENVAVVKDHRILIVMDGEWIGRAGA